MNLLDRILTGVAGTALMTAFMYGMTWLTLRMMNIVRVLGTMLTFRTLPNGGVSDTPRAISVGIIAHYAIGIWFALGYIKLWSMGIGQPDFLWGIGFGFVTGLIAIPLWYGFLAIHPKPPTISLKPYLLNLLLAHIVFAIGVVAAYNLLKK